MMFDAAAGLTAQDTVADMTVVGGRGGETVATIVVRVTSLDPPPSRATVPLSDGLVRNPLSLLSAFEDARLLKANSRSAMWWRRSGPCAAQPLDAPLDADARRSNAATPDSFFQ